MEQEKKLYMYVYRLILNDIFSDIYMYNTKLPTLLKLCEIYNVGRNTVRSALLKLQEEGYIVMQRGKSAIVVFNHNDENLHKQYIQTLSNLKGVIIDAFETMEYLFPYIGTLALKNASDEQINMLIKQVDSFEIDNIHNEAQLVKELFEIYEVGFSLLNNPILDDLVTTILDSIYIPSYTTKNQKKAKKSVKYIQSTLKIILKSKNSFVIKKSIAGLCHSYSKTIIGFINNICKDFEPKDNKKFIWSIHHGEDYLYMKVVTEIVNDINNHVYEKGGLLPSIAQLSIKYEVSERTSRRALETLREYQIVQTINGIGSKVAIDVFKNNSRLLKNKIIKESVEAYYHSSTLTCMINDAVIPKVIKSVSDEELKGIISKISESQYFSLIDLYEFIYSHTNQCLYVAYKELEKYRVWGYFVNMLVEVNQDVLLNKKQSILDSLENRNAIQLSKLIREIMEASMTIDIKK